MTKKYAHFVLQTCLLLSTPCFGQNTQKFVPPCAPSDLDIRALPPARSPSSVGLHLFVLELRNISSEKCTLPAPYVDLLPRSNPNNEPFPGARSPSEREMEYGSRPFLPGDWAHLLIAWRSEAAPELSCDQYSSLKLRLLVHPNVDAPDDPLVEVRHLWIRACGMVAISGYRLGHYTSASHVSDTWLQWFSPPAVTGIKYPAQITTQQIISDSPLLQLHARTQRTMLGDFLSLRLDFPRRPGNNCAFQVIRKRESTGATIISLQQCNEVKNELQQPVPVNHVAGILGFDLKGMDLAPSQIGPVQYDVIAPIGETTSPSYATAHVNLIVRDPAPPGQATILNPLPTCTGPQLLLNARPTIVAERIRTLRAYEAKNTSEKPCSLAGVPALRFLDDKGTDLTYFMPRPCPNCDNDLFAPRPNGRIDLQPGEKAHFLVAATGIDTRKTPWAYCSMTPTFAFTNASGEAPVLLPFAGLDCATIDLSTWRQGSFDNDPLNKQWNKLHQADVSRTTDSIPSDCNKPELLAMGNPRMISGSHDPQLGLSIAKSEFTAGQNVLLHVWADNPTDKPVSITTCSGLDNFKAHGFDLYDAYGHRVLSKDEAKTLDQCKVSPKAVLRSQLRGCYRNFALTIPPHSCLTGSDYDFSASLTGKFDLPPGEYTVQPHQSIEDREDICRPAETKPFHKNPGADITFSVQQP
jgi:Protein of unknown function (DUF4232)